MVDAGTQAPPRRSRRRWIVVALAAAGLVAAGVAVLALEDGGHDEVIRGGPLADPGASMGEAALMDVGRAGTYGAETIENHGTTTAVLDSLVFVGLTPGLRILGPLVARVRTRPGVPALVTGLVRRFPPPHAGTALHSLAGFPVRPWRSWKDAVELLIGFRPLREGVLSYRGLELHYHVGNRRYVARYPDPLAICAPDSFPLSRCKPGRPRSGPGT